MPRYDYLCECGKAIEAQHGINETPTLLCACGRTMRRGFSSGAFILKGQGFYSTDNYNGVRQTV
jgi:putative FmdB family regulatory protein